MASLVLGGVGAVIGLYFGQPGLGYMIGSALGSAFEKGEKGPQAEAPRIMGSSFGEMIPIPYGTKRYPTKVIWVAPAQPHVHKQGKGGDGPETTTWSQSFAVEITDMDDQPAVAVPQIWLDNTLYDESDFSQLPITIYYGTADQMPDPTMEAELGVGNVPGYRRKCIIVFNDLDLNPYGNRIPSINATVATNAGVFPWRVSNFTTLPSGAVAAGSPKRTYSFANGIITIGAYCADSRYYEEQFELDGTPVPFTAYNEALVGGAGGALSGVDGITAGSNGLFGTGWYYKENFVAALSGNAYAVNGQLKYQNGFIFTTGTSGLNIGLSRWPAPEGALTALSAVPDAEILLGTQPGDQFSDFVLARTNRDNVYLWNNATETVYEYAFDLTGGVLRQWDLSAWDAIQAIVNGAGFTVYENVHGDLIFACDRGQAGAKNAGAFYLNADLTSSFIGQVDALSLFIGNVALLGNSGYALIADGVISLIPPPAPVTLEYINNKISARCGLPSYNHTALAPILVDGYSLDHQATGRDHLMPLQPAYSYNMVERAGTMVSVLEGGPSQVTIPENDLACHVVGSDPPALIEISHALEVDLPAQIIVGYVDPATDYQIGSVPARRLVTTSQLTFTLSLNIVMTASQATQIANRALYRAWTARDGLAIQVPRKYWQYEPTDVLTTQGFLMMVRRKNDSVAGVIRFEGEAQNRSLYAQGQAIGSAGEGYTPVTPPPAQQTTLLLLDLPLVTDLDAANGFYADFIPSATTSFPGATLWKSTDGGANYAAMIASNVRGVTGIAQNVLGDFQGGNVFDEGNFVTIIVNPGVVLTSADETAVLAGANPALLGLEMFNYKVADLIATDTYTLSGLLRGQRGTEWAIPAHGINETFVQLPTSANPAALFSELGNSYKYKATTAGQSLAAVTAQDFINNGIALRCYAVAHVGGGPITPFDGTVQLNWQRRTRIGGAWADFNDVPLSEPSERYVVEWTDSTYALCARVDSTLTSPTDTYLAADQVTDFGATQQNLYGFVAQLGSYSLGVRTAFVIPGLGATDDTPLAPVPFYNASPIPPSGGGGSVDTVFSWPSGSVITTTYKVGDTYVVEFTTGGGTPTSGYLSCAEYQDPPTFRRARICADAAGLTTLANGQSWGVECIVDIGPTTCALAAATTYYFVIETIYPDGTPSGVVGASANMIVSLLGAP